MYIKFDIRFIEKIIKFINKSITNRALIVGYVKLPKINEIKLNLSSKLFFTKDFFSNNINNQSLILKKFLLSKKINLMSQKMIFKNFLINKEDQIYKKDHKKLIKIIVNESHKYKKLFKLNLFQSFINDGNRILSFEDIYGTDQLIKKIGKNSNDFQNLIFFKSKKNNQINEIDFPIIGLDTLKLLVNYKIKIICLFNQNIIISEKNKFLEVVRSSNMSLIVL